MTPVVKLLFLQMLVPMALEPCCSRRKKMGERRPVAYVSRAMTQTEGRYAQIEKEALAITWACDRFSDFLMGLKFHVQTDHKPLVPLLSTKGLDELPLRVQRFRMRLMEVSVLYFTCARQESHHCRCSVPSTCSRYHYRRPMESGRGSGSIRGGSISDDPCY